jgi:hypothetical protein
MAILCTALLVHGNPIYVSLEREGAIRIVFILGEDRGFRFPRGELT